MSKRDSGIRCPLVYSAAEIVNWHISEEYELGKWRPARCCPFDGHWMMRLRIAWRVFIGRYDALNWGDRSGEAGRHYKDVTDPEFFSATRIFDPQRKP
jgi:hypothetical protein